MEANFSIILTLTMIFSEGEIFTIYYYHSQIFIMFVKAAVAVVVFSFG